MFLKKIFVIFILLQGFLLFTTFVEAAAIPSSVNLTCWKIDACQSKLKDAFPDASFDPNFNFQAGGVNGECGKDFGLCIPGQRVKAQIKIGNFDVFENMADYFQKYFIYLVSIGGIFAAAILVMAGFMWITSAGSPERIKQAKDYIGSSLLGLMLLLGSYTLLYTINPDLVRLRLPSVYMVRPSVQGAEWCRDLKGASAVLAYAASGVVSSNDVKPEDFKIPANPAITPALLKTATYQTVPMCNSKYFWKDSNDNKCKGSICKAAADGTPKTCSNIDENGKVKGPDDFGCRAGILSGLVTSQDNTIPYPFIDSTSVAGKVISPGLKLAMFCNGGGIVLVADAVLSNTKPNTEQRYLFNSIKGFESTASDCPTAPGPGYFLMANINDSTLGKTSLATSDWQPIGKSGNGICATNLLQAAGGKPITLNSLVGGNIDLGNLKSALKNSFDKVQGNLFTLDELRAGTMCDINLSRSAFPSL